MGPGAPEGAGSRSRAARNRSFGDTSRPILTPSSSVMTNRQRVESLGHAFAAPASVAGGASVPVCAARHKPYERGVGDDAAGQRWIDDENAGENSDGIGLPRTRNVRDRGSTPREPSGGDTALRGICCTAPRIDWEVLSMN